LEKRKKADDLDEALMHSVRYMQKDSKGDWDIYLFWGTTDWYANGGVFLEKWWSEICV